MIKTCVLSISLAGAGFAACGSGYSHCRAITFDHTKAGASDTANYPALISGTYSYLALVGSGGLVQHTTTQAGGQPITVPADVVFTSDSACSTRLNWEFETYDSTSGAINAHVNIGTLSHTVDTVIYECAGNPAVSTWQGNVNATWDSNYKFVGHMADNTATTTMIDSTGNANHATNQSITSSKATTGKIDGALSYPTAGDYAYIPPITLANNVTFSAWVKLNALNTYGRILESDFGSAYALTLNSGGDSYAAYVGGTAISGGTADTARWHHVVFTYDGGNGHLFIDGTEVARGALSPPGSHSLPFYVVTWSGAPGFYGSQGIVDEIRISNTNRSADQVLADYNNQSSPSTFYTVGPDLDLGGEIPIPFARRRII